MTRQGGRILAIAALLAGGLALGGCASGGGASGAGGSAAPAAAPRTTTSPIADGDIEHTTFAPGLGVDLSKMTRRPTGLYVQDFQIGSGSVAAQGRTAVLRYAGYLPDGKEFDSGEITISIGAKRVIRAWDEGVLGMRVGGKRRLISPPHLAYGAQGSPPTIPPNAVLIFDMELTQVY